MSLTRQSKVTFVIENDSTISASSSSAIYLPEAEETPGLEELDQTDQLFIVEDKNDLPYSLGVPIRKHYKILNIDGKHIFTAVEATPCSTGATVGPPKFVVYIFPVGDNHDEPILKILQCHEKSMSVRNLLETRPFMERDRLINRMLPRPATTGSCKCGRQNVKAFIHVQHLDKGIVGSIMWDSKDYQILSSDLRGILTAPMKLPRTPTEPPPSPPRTKISCLDSRWNYYDFYVTVNSENVLPEVPLGRVSFDLETPPKGPDGPNGDVRKSKEEPGPACICITYPIVFTTTEKCLVLAFAISVYCRTESCWKKTRTLLFKVLPTIIIIAIMLTAVIGLACKMFKNETCRTFF